MIKIFKNKRQKALVLLVFWTLFAISMFIFIEVEKGIIAKKEQEYNEKYNFKVDFNYVKNSLLNNDFNYLFIIKDDEILLSYKGKRENNIYSNINDDYKYLDVKKIFELSDDSFKKNNNTFLYEKEDFYVKIKVSVDNIVNINIKEGKIEYILEFTDIKDFDVKGSE